MVQALAQDDELVFFDVDKPIEFKGTINEDLTSSVTHL